MKPLVILIMSLSVGLVLVLSRCFHVAVWLCLLSDSVVLMSCRHYLLKAETDCGFWIVFRTTEGA